MKKLIYKFLFPESDNYMKRDFIWNTMAGLLNAVEAVVLLSIVTRICGVEEAGYLSIAFAVANLFVAIGKYGVRHFQVTNDEDSITLESYRNMRILSILCMLFFCFIYIVKGIIQNGYTWYKACIVMLMCIIYAVESMEDSYWGFLQRNKRLAAGAKIFVLRWGSILFIIPIGLYCGCSLLEILLIATIVSWLIYIVCINVVRKEYNYIASKWNWTQIELVFKKCTPLALAVFFNYYICNAPKYTIDSFMSDEMQAYYGYIAMPVFAIQLLSNFIFQPILVRISSFWKDKKVNNFKESIYKQFVIIFILTVFSLFGTYFLGTPILTIIYGIDLSIYKKELMFLMTGGGLLALDGFLNIILTIMDCRKEILIGYGTGALIALLFLPKFVMSFGIMGAVIGYCGIMLLLAIYFNIKVWHGIKKET